MSTRLPQSELSSAAQRAVQALARLRRDMVVSPDAEVWTTKGPADCYKNIPLSTELNAATYISHAKTAYLEYYYLEKALGSSID